MPKVYAAGDRLPASDINAIVKSAGVYAVPSGGTDTYAITVTPTPASYVDGDVFRFKADVLNTGAATLNVNGLGAKALVRINGDALLDGDILAGQVVEVQYNGTSMVIISPIARGTETLVASALNVNKTANATEQTIATYSIPANRLGIRHGVRIKLRCAHVANQNGDNLTLKFKFGGTTLTHSLTGTVGADYNVYDDVTILNTSASAQVYNTDFKNTVTSATWQNIGCASGTAAVDTTSAVTVSVTSQTSDGTNAVRVFECTIEYLYAL